MINVFLLTPDLEPCGVSGQARLLAMALAKNRFRVTIGVMATPQAAAWEELSHGGITVLSLPLRHALDYSGIKRLRSAVQEAQTQIVHSWGTDATRIARFVLTRHSDGANLPRLIVSSAADPETGLTGWLTTRWLRQADRVVASTWAEGERYRHHKVRPERLNRVGPATWPHSQPATTVSFPPRLTIPVGSRVIVTSGRSGARTSPKDAIVAFDMLRYDARDLYLVVYGAGSETQKLEQFGRALAFDDFRIRFAPCDPGRSLGAQLASVVWALGHASDVSLALEAMVSARPVVGWRTGDLSEIVEDGVTGFLVPVGDRAALAGKTRLLFDDTDLARRMGEAGRVRATDRFGMGRMADQFGQIYEELATGTMIAPKT